MGLDTKSNSSLWKDKALIELNHAILYTFQVNKINLNVKKGIQNEINFTFNFKF
jgi:nitric oxide synthase oxygenase domain/subunit